jgi:hypothetical protein
MSDSAKACTKCKEIKELEHFYCYKSRYETWCKSCKLAKEREWYLANKDTAHATQKRSHDLHKETGKAAVKRWGEANKDRKLENTRRWQKENPGLVNAITARRRAVKLQATPEWLTEEQWAEIDQFYVLAKELQWLSDPTDPLEVDHIIPLQGKNVSGLHVPWNLQILPKTLNLIKSNKVIK